MNELFLTFSADHDVEAARGRFVERFGVAPVGVWLDEDAGLKLLRVGPVGGISVETDFLTQRREGKKERKELNQMEMF